MSIANFIEKSLSNFFDNRIDVSLSLACSAIDATSKILYPDIHNNNERFKNFIDNYFKIISKYGFPGIITKGIKIKCTLLDDVKTDDELINFNEIIYKVIRCGLIHECKIDDKLRFSNETLIGEKDNYFYVPKNIVIGLLMAVVYCTANKDEQMSSNFVITLRDELIDVNKSFGQEKFVKYKPV